MPPKRKRDLEIPGKADFPGRTGTAGLDEAQWRACRTILEDVYKRKEGHVSIAEIFCQLPDRQLYQDYYVTISEPECLDNIAVSLGEQKYPSPEAFFAQLHLVFLNAKHYNEEGSQVWEDADTFEKQIKQAWQDAAIGGTAKQAPPAESTTYVVPTQPTLPKAEFKAAGPADHGLSPADQQVVAATEARYPRWSGPLRVIPGHYPGGIVGSGWWGEGMGIIEDVSRRIKDVWKEMSAYKSGAPFSALSAIPADAQNQIPYLAYTANISLSAIQNNEYRSLADFDVDMMRLFERARRWYPEQSTEYGQIISLQRMYQAVTGSTQTDPKHHYASVVAGPGKAKEAEDDEPDQILTREPGYLERKYTSSARWKGLEYKAGDWVHLINPDDASRPIVGQIWKTYIPTTKGKRTHHVSVAWYFRPEQTVHTAKQQFYKREVLRSGWFCDHPVEDIIERAAVQPGTKYLRGRPKAGDYYPGWPLYVCVNRYSEKAWKVSPIQHWQSGLPEEVRNGESAITYFERPIAPILQSSPLHTVKNVPGFFADPRAGDEAEFDPPTPSKARARRPPVPAPVQVAPLVNVPLPPPSTETFAMMVGGAQHLDQVAYKEPLPIETSRLFERDARQTVLWFSGPPIPDARAAAEDKPAHSLAYLAHLARS